MPGLVVIIIVILVGAFLVGAETEALVAATAAVLAVAVEELMRLVLRYWIRTA